MCMLLNTMLSDNKLPGLFVKICLFVVPFDVWDGLWVLIRPVPEEFLLL